MRVAQLQGTPWHWENRKRTCKDGSTYCLYNHNICGNKVSIYYHKKCVGKGSCDDFESKGNSVIQKTNNKNTFKLNNGENMEKNSKQINKPNKHEKFIELGEKRVNDIINRIDTLSNLSNRNSYEYSTEEVEKMFNSIEKSLNDAKDKFKTNHKPKQKFKF